jgi:hypothetical protein
MPENISDLEQCSGLEMVQTWAGECLVGVNLVRKDKTRANWSQLEEKHGIGLHNGMICIGKVVYYVMIRNENV